jgi:hypothetical protein
MDLSTALAAYDRVSLNLDKLDRIWHRMQELLPDGPFISAGNEDEVTYDQLGESWSAIAASLPAIDGWRLQADIIPFSAIGQARLDYMEIGEQEGLRAFESTVQAPGTEALRYRQKLARARQGLVRGRGAELVRSVDELLGPVWSCDLAGPRLGRVGASGVKRWGVSTSTIGC